MTFAEGPQASAVLRRSKLRKPSHAIFQGYQFFSVARWFCSKELVVAIAGLALPGTIGTIGTIGKGPVVALKDDSHREAALITFLFTLSGVVIAGIGAAFWGVVALFVQQYGQSRSAAPWNFWRARHANPAQP